MKNIRSNIWNFYLTFPIKKKIKRSVFFQRFKRYIKLKNNILSNEDIYDFLFIKIIKKDFFKWSKIFKIKKIIFE